MMTKARSLSNSKAKRELGRELRYPSSQQGLQASWREAGRGCFQARLSNASSQAAVIAPTSGRRMEFNKGLSSTLPTRVDVQVQHTLDSDGNDRCGHHDLMFGLPP